MRMPFKDESQDHEQSKSPLEQSQAQYTGTETVQEIINSLQTTAKDGKDNAKSEAKSTKFTQELKDSADKDMKEVDQIFQEVDGDTPDQQENEEKPDDQATIDA